MLISGESTSVGPQEYFADISFDDPKFASESLAFADAWIEFVQNCGIDRRWTQNLFLYNGSDPAQTQDGQFDENSFKVVGDNGELLYVSYNDFRNLLQHILNMTVSQPPNMMAQAINDDTESLIAAETFDGVFDYYMTTYQSGRLLRESRKTVEYALVEDTGYMLVEWDPYAGKPTGPKMAPVIDEETGAEVIGPDGQPAMEPEVDERGQTQLQFEGDLYFKSRSPWDVFFDPGCEDDEEVDWVMVRDQVNKHTYANRYPKFKDRILASTNNTNTKLTQWRRGLKRATKTDLIDVYKFYHRPTSAMPQGRYAIILDAATVLLDGPNPYDGLPVFNVRAMEGMGSLIGYAPANVLAPVQLSQNLLSSAMMTNYSMFGVQNVAVKDSDQFDVQEIAGAMNILKYTDAPPAPLMLAQQANGIGEFYAALGRKGETLSGINSVVRGDPESSLKSGKALGIVQAAAVQFQSALAASYAQFLKNVGNFMLQVFRKYVKAERITQIVGKNEQMQSATWSADTFGPIDRVAAQIEDPAMRTLGYKTDLAMFMAQNNLTQTPQEFLTVLTTGQLKPMYRGQLTTLNTIKQENRDMLEAAKMLEQQEAQLKAQFAQQQEQAAMHGAQLDPMILEQQLAQLAQQLAPPVIRWDDDDLHMQEHPTVATSPAVRRNSAVTRIVAAHMEMHENNKIVKAQKAAIDQAKVQLGVQQSLASAQAAAGPAPAPQQVPPQQQAPVRAA